MTTDGRLTLAHFRQDRGHTVIVGGELDLMSMPTLIDAVTQLLGEEIDELTLDLGDLTFLDSVGLQALRKVQRLCESHDCKLVLTLVRPHIRELFAVTGVEEHLPLRDDPPRES